MVGPGRPPPRRQGRCVLNRFADALLLGGACEAEARRLRDVLPQRFTRFGLTMPPEHTALLACQRPSSRHPSAGGTGPCDWLGLPHSWGTTRQGDGGIKRQTVGKRLRRVSPVAVAQACPSRCGPVWWPSHRLPLVHASQASLRQPLLAPSTRWCLSRAAGPHPARGVGATGAPLVLGPASPGG